MSHFLPDEYQPFPHGLPASEATTPVAQPEPGDSQPRRYCPPGTFTPKECFQAMRQLKKRRRAGDETGAIRAAMLEIADYFEGKTQHVSACAFHAMLLARQTQLWKSEIYRRIAIALVVIPGLATVILIATLWMRTNRELREINEPSSRAVIRPVEPVSPTATRGDAWGPSPRGDIFDRIDTKFDPDAFLRATAVRDDKGFSADDYEAAAKDFTAAGEDGLSLLARDRAARMRGATPIPIRRAEPVQRR